MAKEKRNEVVEYENRIKRKTTLFELSVLSVMPMNVYKEIKERMELVQIYLEDGAYKTALEILNGFLRPEVKND
jgi:hypothetical protein